MSVSDRIHTSLVSYGGSTIDERVYNYLGSLGLTGTISDRLAKYSHNGKKGWKAIIEGFGLSLSAGFVRQELFGESQQGVLYVSQPSYLGQQVLYQDAAGTTPVVDDGDPVGLRLDLSGNGNHQSQPTSADRPIYRTDGARHWISFNGVNHKLLHDELPIPSTTCICVVGFRTNSLANSSFPLVYGNRNGAFDNAHRMPLIHLSQANPERVTTQWGADGNATNIDYGSTIVDERLVVSAVYGAANERNYLNGELQNTSGGRAELIDGTGFTSGTSPSGNFEGDEFGVVLAYDTEDQSRAAEYIKRITL